MEKKLPSAYRRFAEEQPRLVQAYEQLSAACLKEGPLDRQTAELVKIGIAVGARLEGAVHSHVRRALDAGATPDQIRHAIRLALTTIGFPSMMATLSWASDVLEERRGKGAPEGRRRGDPPGTARRGRRTGQPRRA